MPSRLKKAIADTGLNDAIINARGKLNGKPVIVSAMEYSFIGGSMGSVVGETITRAVERATNEKIPLIIVSASGGARMMEGVVSLMQLAKISAALARMDDAKVPYISVLTDPTTGGTTASFAMLGDLNIAEPGALIGFAGPRVIEQTIRQKLPEGFQRSEFLLQHGMLDAVVHRRDMKDYISRALDFMQAPNGGRRFIERVRAPPDSNSHANCSPCRSKPWSVSDSRRVRAAVRSCAPKPLVSRCFTLAAGEIDESCRGNTRGWT